MSFKSLLVILSVILLFQGAANTNHINSRKKMMVEKNKDAEAAVQRGELDPLALEAANEVSSEFLHRSAAIMQELPEDEQEQVIMELIKEMTIRVNEIYQRKKQERSEQ